MFLYKKLAGMARRKQIRLTIVDKNNYNCFHGMVPEMIAGKISADSLLNPLRSVFRHAQFRNGTVERIDVDNKKVVYSRGLDGKEFTIAIALGGSYQSTATKLLQSLAEPFERHREAYVRQWQRTTVLMTKETHSEHGC